MTSKSKTHSLSSFDFSHKNYADPDPFDLIGSYIHKQSNLTAVQKFAQFHNQEKEHLSKSLYRDLIPSDKLNENEQFAFEVDLDLCTGCKACVSACHNLNGLEENESFREVGLLKNQSLNAVGPQHVSSSCHHCLEPACSDGCPVNAYEKDPITGIVKHLDDQCIGCQYCILKCPYDVPKYSKSKGIVRKCDMCSDRLKVGEAPACVGACPTKAIKIVKVDKNQLRQVPSSNFLKNAPDPNYTIPSSAYKNQNPILKKMIPADHHFLKREHSHPSLLTMLVLTQLSVGIYALDYFWTKAGFENFSANIHSIFALSVACLALLASIFHLGRPQYAYRAILGIKKSWLSREILVFGLFAGAAALFSFNIWPIMDWLVPFLGILGVFCSAMVYHDTKRSFWNIKFTATKFMLTPFILGIPFYFLLIISLSYFDNNSSPQAIGQVWSSRLFPSLMVLSILKISLEMTILFRLEDDFLSPLKKSAMLLTTELRRVLLVRLFFGLTGGILLPLFLLNISLSPVLQSKFFLFLSSLMCLSLLISEFLERYLFFSAVIPMKMPGGIRV